MSPVTLSGALDVQESLMAIGTAHALTHRMTGSAIPIFPGDPF